MIRTVAGGKRLAVIGVTSAAQKVAGSYLLLPVPAAVRDAVAELGGKADCVIVAGWIEGQPALDLAREFPEISLVLAGHVPRGSDELLRRDGAPVAVGGERAQYVVVVGMNAACAPVGARRVWLGEDTAEDPALYARVRAWKEDLRRRGDDAVAASLSEFKNAGRVGSQACAECHDAEHRIWRATKHARAMDSLRAKQEDRNALCLSCHLQDIRVQDGSAVVDRDGGVGCEGCHGPGARHIGAKRRKEPTTPMNAIGKVGAASCLRCHDEENSRNFEFGRFWSAVKHPEATPEKR
jgi:hypothetical protein